MNAIWVESQDGLRVKLISNIRFEMFEDGSFRVLCDGAYFGKFDNLEELNTLKSKLYNFIGNGKDDCGFSIFSIPTIEEIETIIKKRHEALEECKKSIIRSGGE